MDALSAIKSWAINYLQEAVVSGIKGDTGRPGLDGKDGKDGEDGFLFMFEIDEYGHLIMFYETTEPVPDMQINEDGHLIYTF